MHFMISNLAVQLIRCLMMKYFFQEEMSLEAESHVHSKSDGVSNFSLDKLPIQCETTMYLHVDRSLMIRKAIGFEERQHCCQTG